MYSLNVDYFTEEFSSFSELEDYCRDNGMDPNYEITKDGKGTGETLWDIWGPMV